MSFGNDLRPTRLARVFIALVAAGGFACDGCGGKGGVQDSGSRALLTPDTLNFGYVLVGQSKTVNVTVRSIGRGALRIVGTDETGDFKNTADRDELRYTPPRMNLVPGEQQDLTVIFQPSEPGVRSGTILLHSYDSADPIELPVVGQGITANLGFDPSQLARDAVTGAIVDPPTIDFGSVVLDEVGRRTASLVNEGDTPVEVFVDPLSGERPEFFSSELPGANQTYRVLSAGERLDFALAFQPAAVGQSRAVLSVRPCPTCTPTKLVLSGKGIAAGLVAEPAELDFGAVIPNTKATKAITFRNVGNKKIAITNVKPVQAGSEFAVVPLAPWPTLAPGDTAKVDFTYQPAGMGRDSTTFQVLTDDARSPSFDVRLLGYGGGPVIEATPAALEFNTVAVGFPVKRRLVVSNKGLNDPTGTDDNLMLYGAELAAGDFALSIASGASLGRTCAADTDCGGLACAARPDAPASKVCAIAIPPGSRQVIDVTYGPTGVGEDRAVLTLRSNDPDRLSLDVPLRGAGQFLPPCDYEVFPAASPGLQFGVVQRGRTSRLNFTLHNRGAGKCVIGSLEIDPAAGDVFRLPAGPVYGRVLEPGERLSTEVEFAPPGTATSGTAYASVVNVGLSSAQAPTVQMQLTGRGAEVCLSITPVGVDFGVVSPNCETNNRVFTIYNACGQNVRITNITEGQLQTEFRVLKPTLPITLQPQGQLRFNARYRPADLGLDYGTIEVYTDQQVTGNPPQPYVLTLQGKGENDARVAENFVQAERAEADILFVVDDSGSMSEEQTALASNFSAFMSFAIAQQVDYRIAATTSSTLATSSCDPGSENGRFVPVNGANRVVTNALSDPGGQFGRNVNVGTNGCAFEMPIEAAYRALSDPNINGANAGFLRPEAYLSVILVSDEDDQSPQPIDFYVNFFQNIKGPRGANLVSVSTITGLLDPRCSGPGGSSEYGQRAIAMSQRTGGIAADICSSNWAAELQKLGLIAFGYKSRFILNSDPDPTTIRVTIDDDGAGPNPPVEVPAGPYWSYTADTNSVDFLPTAVPPAGSHIAISYAVTCN